MTSTQNFFTNIKAQARIHDFTAEGKMSPVEFTVGIILCRYMGDRDVCWPTREEISQMTGIRRIKTVSAAITHLVKIGFIDRERTQRGVLYRFRNDNPDGADSDTSEDTPIASPGSSDGADNAPPENGQTNPDGAYVAPSDGAYVAPSDGAHVAPPYTLMKTKENIICAEQEIPFLGEQGEERNNASEPATKPPTPKPESIPPKGKNKGGANVLPPAGAKGKAKAKKPPTPKATWDGKAFTVPDVLMDSWREAYPGVDLGAQIKKAAAWCVSNPRKAPKGDFNRFLNGWLSRSEPAVAVVRPAPSESTGEAKRMMQYFRKNTDVRRDW